MVKRLKKLKKIRIHREGTDQLSYGLFGLVAIAVILWRCFESHVPFWCFLAVFGTCYCIVLNFYRCPIRKFHPEGTPEPKEGEEVDTAGICVAPADGKIVVVEEVMENTYFHEPRLMISIFMSLFNVHANWIPVDGKIKKVEHFNGNFHKAWLPKASEENEHADIVIEDEMGEQILCRQIAGAMARRIVTYSTEGDDCYVDEHLGFIKLGSRVDVYLPLSYKPCVKLGQSTTGDLTIIAKRTT